MSNLNLLTRKRFFGLFVTQFMGAFNDNFFKNAVALMIAFRAASESEAGMWVNLAGGLFILPFALLSPLSGQIADKFDKAKILRMVKLAEIPIMMLAGLGFYTNSNPMLMATIFLMGSQSAFFGPAKYSILPQHLDETELTAGNGLISMSTFIAIIVGLISATIFVSRELTQLLPICIISVAGLGYLSSRIIPTAPSTQPDLKINFNFFSQFKELWKYSNKVRSVHLSIFAVSWLWFIGSVMLTQMPALSKFVLMGSKDMSTTLTLLFVIGICIGSFLTIMLSRGEIELGLVPLGSLGMTVFGLDLYFIDYAQAVQGTLSIYDYVWGVGGFSRWRLLADLALIGVFASFYVIPLNALIQARSDDSVRSQIISANNIMNAIFMVTAAVITMILYAMKLKTPEVFAVFFIANFVVTGYIFSVVPEFTLRFIFWIFSNFTYRINFRNRDLIPRHGSAVIVANHISFVDWFIITAACRRPVYYVMDHTIFKTPVLGMIFRFAKAIPIATAKEDPKIKEQAFEKISEVLKDDNIVCIFPEGGITKTGEMMDFRPGVEGILSKDPCPVIPIAIKGLWGSWFSRKGGPAMKGTPKPKFRKIVAEIGEPLPSTATCKTMQSTIQAMIDRD